MFKIIPALDLKDGIVVHGVGGNRDYYQPIDSIHSSTPEPAAIMAGLQSFYPFDIVYVADLNAIDRDGQHDAVILDLLETWPHLEIWCDAGLQTGDDIYRIERHERFRPIAGTETLYDINALNELNDMASIRPVLSLDFKSGSFLGDPRILNAPNSWTDDVIVLSLDHVGASSGPPLTQIHDASTRSEKAGKACRLYAGGGSRRASDLMAMKNEGIAGAVVATAIHRGHISEEEIQKLCDG